MALALSGSNGGIGEYYRSFIEEDVKAGITKYQNLYKQLPESENDVKKMYSQVISDLEKIGVKMKNPLKNIEKFVQG